ncbi:C69 family dipeptidase [Loigolactobacillus zhaoyuanensis]|uniref:C69 family dipeptidase n=1 Tax=Loigolactobacillus zhaoyuanensis TaxID=2486017 RepID=UPI000F738DD6|nr:C69 family dipeptidase [Loigolactobacillus zhaoyuanensis]
MQKQLLTSLSACTSILVGKQASADGSIFIGRNEDSKAAWPKHFISHPRQTHTTAPVFKSKDTGFTLTLPLTQAKYNATPEWTTEFGVFEEDGFNEYGVAMSATESAYANERVLAYDPLVKNGIAEEAMVTVVLPYVKTARAGVLRLGELVDQYGTAETNGILFADNTEAWYMETATGHHWVAQRIPDDAYAVVANQLSIQTIDFMDQENFLSSATIQKFARQHHLWRTDTPFNFRAIFGTHTQSDFIYNTPRVWYGQKILTPTQPQKPMSDDLPFIQRATQPITFEQIAQILGSHYQGTKYDPVGRGKAKNQHKFRPISLAKTQESHILQIRPELPAPVADIHWLAMGVTAESIYVPFYAGADQTPADYQIGGATYDPKSSYWLYKLAGVLVDSHYHAFSQLLSGVQTATHTELLRAVAQHDAAAQVLTGTALIDFLNQANQQHADLARTNFSALIADMITQATDLSPLNFNTDENL